MEEILLEADAIKQLLDGVKLRVNALRYACDAADAEDAAYCARNACDHIAAALDALEDFCFEAQT